MICGPVLLYLSGVELFLLRRQIEASGKIGRLIFVDEINANAKGYEFCISLKWQAGDSYGG